MFQCSVGIESSGELLPELCRGDVGVLEGDRPRAGVGVDRGASELQAESTAPCGLDEKKLFSTCAGWFRARTSARPIGRSPALRIHAPQDGSLSPSMG